MTPEQYAQAVIDEIDGMSGATSGAALRAWLRDRVEEIVTCAVAAERERCAAYMDSRADAIEASTNTVTGKAIASIFRDEATQIRKG